MQSQRKPIREPLLHLHVVGSHGFYWYGRQQVSDHVVHFHHAQVFVVQDLAVHDELAGEVEVLRFGLLASNEHLDIQSDGLWPAFRLPTGICSTFGC